MKKYTYPQAVQRAVDAEYTHKAPEALRLKLRALMAIPLVKPWQFIGTVTLLLACPLTFYLISSRLVYSESMLLMLNIAVGASVFMIIFAGVAHRFSDPKHKAELLDKISALRARI